MLVLVSYDVNTQSKAGVRRLAKVAKHCVNFGQRVQNSVFECILDYGQFLQFKAKLLSLIDKEHDSVRFYLLGNKWETKVEHYGCSPCVMQNDVLVL